MKNINVIDLDKTLIPYDSFGRFVKKEIRLFNLKVITLTVFRVLRFINLKNYKKRIFIIIENKYDISFFKKYARRICEDIDIKALKEVIKETDSDTINILLSASPDLYVKYFIEEMKWVGKGSYFDENQKFIHLHGNGKKLWVEENYPTKKYQYNMAISDSSSDNDLLKLFNKEIKWILP